jgi:non-ribosomal peptide synthetase component F
MENQKNEFQSPLDLFSKQVKEFGSNTALVHKSEGLTFRELDILSNKLANFMLSKGVKQGKPIGILCNKNLHTLLAILAAWKIGCPYVPIDIESPISRIKYILEVCDVEFSIVDGKLMNNWPAQTFEEQFFLVVNYYKNNPINRNALWDEVLQFASDPICSKLHPDDLAYIIFTSGSTGQPKGVSITYANISTFFRWCATVPGIEERSKALNIANFSFDQSLMDLAFLFGCGTEIHLYDNIKHPLLIADYIKNQNINLLSSVPTIFGMFFDHRFNLSSKFFSNLKKIFVGGAAC